MSTWLRGITAAENTWLARRLTIYQNQGVRNFQVRLNNPTVNLAAKFPKLGTLGGSEKHFGADNLFTWQLTRCVWPVEDLSQLFGWRTRVGRLGRVRLCSSRSME